MNARLYSWMTERPQGGESQVGAMFGGYHVPLTTTSPRLANGPYRDLALRHAGKTGQRTWLRIWSAHEDCPPIHPGSKP